MNRFDRLMTIRRKVVFRKPKGCVGWFEGGGGGKIWVAIGRGPTNRRVPPAQIYLHELLHTLYPDWPEKKVLATERRMWRRLTAKQRYRLYRKLFSRSFRDHGGEE